jgi:hypothetical protein
VGGPAGSSTAAASLSEQGPGGRGPPAGAGFEPEGRCEPQAATRGPWCQGAVAVELASERELEGHSSLLSRSPTRSPTPPGGPGPSSLYLAVALGRLRVGLRLGVGTHWQCTQCCTGSRRGLELEFVHSDKATGSELEFRLLNYFRPGPGPSRGGPLSGSERRPDPSHDACHGGGASESGARPSPGPAH